MIVHKRPYCPTEAQAIRKTPTTYAYAISKITSVSDSREIRVHHHCFHEKNNIVAFPPTPMLEGANYYRIAKPTIVLAKDFYHCRQA